MKTKQEDKPRETTNEREESKEPKKTNYSEYLHPADCQCGDCLELDSPEYYGE